ncbi:hypothetical protein [Methylopila sp. M107]|uniref:hypothetical protein n=1 Tax=Methylopila sp. M107 TaxID=1101190 RepID=UPI000369080D|nr:hypothetical protein [Methylopila sp. M107]
MKRKIGYAGAAAVAFAALLAFLVPLAVQRYAAFKVDAALSRIGYQTTSMVQRGAVSVDVWSWTVNVGNIEIVGAGGATRTSIGRMSIASPGDAAGRMTADRMILDDVKVKAPGEIISIPRAEIRFYSGPESGLTATPGLGRNVESQADLFENVSIGRIVAPIVVFVGDKSGLRRTVRNLVVNDMRDGVISSATADAITLDAPYLPPSGDGAPSSLLISTGEVRYDGLSLPTLWRFRDGDPGGDRKQLLKSVTIADIALSLTLRPGGRFSASIKKLDAVGIQLRPLGFAISSFDPVATGMRFNDGATPQEVREQMAFALSLLRSASFERISMTDAQAQLTSASDPLKNVGVGLAEIGPYADARLETVRLEKLSQSNAEGFKLALGGGRAYGFDASGALQYADRVARDEVLLTTRPSPAEMLKIIPRIKALDAQDFDVSSADGALRVDRARIEINAPLDAVPQNVMFRLDGLDASPPPDSEAQRWIERMELEGLKGSAKFSLTLNPADNVLSLDWMDYGFEGLGKVSASGKLERVDPVLAVSTGADFVDKFSAIRLAPFKLTLTDDGATGVLLRRAAAKAGEQVDAYREDIATEAQAAFPRLLGPPAEQSGQAAAEFIRDPRQAEVTLAPRRMDQTLLDLIRAAQLGPVGLAQVVDLTVLYKR